MVHTPVFIAPSARRAGHSHTWEPALARPRPSPHPCQPRVGRKRARFSCCVCARVFFFFFARPRGGGVSFFTFFQPLHPSAHNDRLQADGVRVGLPRRPGGLRRVIRGVTVPLLRRAQIPPPPARAPAPLRPAPGHPGGRPGRLLRGRGLPEGHAGPHPALAGPRRPGGIRAGGPEAQRGGGGDGGGAPQRGGSGGRVRPAAPGHAPALHLPPRRLCLLSGGRGWLPADSPGLHRPPGRPPGPGPPAGPARHGRLPLPEPAGLHFGD